MAVWSIIAVIAGACWIGVLALVWLLCYTAKRADDPGADATLVAERLERAPTHAHRR